MLKPLVPVVLAGSAAAALLLHGAETPGVVATTGLAARPAAAAAPAGASAPLIAPGPPVRPVVSVPPAPKAPALPPVVTPGAPQVPATAPARTVQVYALGDSITDGLTYEQGTPVGVQDVTAPGGYRGFLDAILTADGVTHRFVGSRSDNASPAQVADGQDHHDGWPGWRIDMDDNALDGYTAGFGHWMTGGGGAAPLYPDVVVVQLGTNDVRQHYDPSAAFPTGSADYGDPQQRARFVADMTGRLQGLVSHLQRLRPGVRIVVSDGVPLSTTSGEGMADSVTPAYAAAVRSLVAGDAARGQRVVLADVWAGFTRSTAAGTVILPGLVGPDGVHPTAGGYSVMGGTMATAVTGALTAWPVR